MGEAFYPQYSNKALKILPDNDMLLNDTHSRNSVNCVELSIIHKRLV